MKDSMINGSLGLNSVNAELDLLVAADNKNEQDKQSINKNNLSEDVCAQVEIKDVDKSSINTWSSADGFKQKEEAHIEPPKELIEYPEIQSDFKDANLLLKETNYPESEDFINEKSQKSEKRVYGEIKFESFNPKYLPELQKLPQGTKLIIAEALQTGYKNLTSVRIEMYINLGKAYKTIKEAMGSDAIPLINKYWNNSQENKLDLRIRSLEIAAQLDTFYTTYPSFTKMIPIDSALSIMRYVNNYIKSQCAKKKFLQAITKTGTYKNVPIIKSRKLREAIKQEKEFNREELTKDEFYFQKFSKAVKRSISLTEEAIEILIEEMLRLNPVIQKKFISKNNKLIRGHKLHLIALAENMESKLENIEDEIKRRSENQQHIKPLDDDFDSELV